MNRADPSGGDRPRKCWRAYGDESEPDQRSGPGVYLMAVMVIEDQAEDAARQMAQDLRLRGLRKLHWHDEDTARRKQLVDAVAELAALHLVAVRGRLVGASSA